MANRLVIHHFDLRGYPHGFPHDRDRSVSYDGVVFGTVYRVELEGYPDATKWYFSPNDDDDLPRNLRGIKCKDGYDYLWQIRAELISRIQDRRSKPAEGQDP